MSDSHVQFRSVLRGYDPVQVDQHMNELAQAAASVWQEATERTVQVNELRAANDQLKSELKRQSQRVSALEEAQEEFAAPTYAGLGERIGSILGLVDKEAHEVRTRAHADAANHQALADESALATRQDADQYAVQTRSAADDEVAGILEEARQQANNLLEDAEEQADNLLNDARRQADTLRDEFDRQAMARQDADRQAMAQREAAERAYEMARAKSAAAAVDFETTLAARRDASALEFAAQVAAAEQQLAAIRLRSEQTRNDSEQAQQEVAIKCAQQIEQAMARAQTIVDDAKTKAERIRSNSERDLAAATQRRDSINTQLSNVRQELAALTGASRLKPLQLAEPVSDEARDAAGVEQEDAAEAFDGEKVTAKERRPSN